jgi:hypothetical protein
MNSIFQRLPIEIVEKILTYDGTILKERNGKCMKQISKEDKRYEIFQTIPIKHVVFNNYIGAYIHVRFTNKYLMTMTEYNDANMIVYILLTPFNN